MATIPSGHKSTGPQDSAGTWEMVREQQDDIIYYSLHFSDVNNGWIVGYEGTIQHTSDGGDTWAAQQSEVLSNLWDIDFVDSLTGWICGADNTILKTTDGGNSWINISPVDTVDKINTGLEFITDDFGWMASNAGEILMTADGGLSWELKKRFDHGGAQLTVFDERTIYIFRGQLYRTYDGGATWDTLAVPYDQNYAKFGAFFTDRDNGWIPTQNMTGGEFITEFPVFITNDGGRSWHASDMLSEGGLTTIFFINNDVGWVGGFRNIHKTTNGGRNWTVEYTRDDPNLYARDMMFVDENHGWLLNFNGEVFRHLGSGY